MAREHSPWRPHPWHGLSQGPDPPRVVTVFVEITPFDHVKCEIDKRSGFLRIDRPQYSSSLPPSVYGFIPRTFTGCQPVCLVPFSEARTSS
ncbi:MAG: inorganic diphosphatase [Desulfomonilia bacterium]